jgi:hypothetical protein
MRGTGHTTRHHEPTLFTTTRMITVIRKQRPVLPGETLPPAPPSYKKPSPQLPPIK